LLSTGKQVYDLGVVPIPSIPYSIAYWDCHDSPVEISLALYKSASHNPASQDGLKVFLKTYDPKGAAIYVKAPLELELTIAALIYREAVTQPEIREKGLYHKADKIAGEVLSRTMQDTKNLPPLKSVAFLVIDLANGAFAYPPSQEVLNGILESSDIGNILFVGNHPDGKNINGNEGQERVGSAHLENVYEIHRQDIEFGGKFFGFPAIKALMDFGKTQYSQAENGGTAWAILVDGDGDRCYTAVYEPLNDLLHVIDGDEAFFYHVIALEQAKKIKTRHYARFYCRIECSFYQYAGKISQEILSGTVDSFRRYSC